MWGTQVLPRKWGHWHGKGQCCLDGIVRASLFAGIEEGGPGVIRSDLISWVLCACLNHVPGRCCVCLIWAHVIQHPIFRSELFGEKCWPCSVGNMGCWKNVELSAIQAGILSLAMLQHPMKIQVFFVWQFDMRMVLLILLEKHELFWIWIRGLHSSHAVGAQNVEDNFPFEWDQAWKAMCGMWDDLYPALPCGATYDVGSFVFTLCLFCFCYVPCTSQSFLGGRGIFK